jgi:hypothetical protein
MVEAIAKLCHPDGIEIGFDGGPELSAEQTMAAIKGNEVVTLFEATLIFQGRLARVDILKKDGDTFELIEVKAKSVDTSAVSNPFRGAKGRISSPEAAQMCAGLHDPCRRQTGTRDFRCNPDGKAGRSDCRTAWLPVSCNRTATRPV